MTELEAVNILLSTIGEAPVKSLANEDENEITDSALAQNVLAEVSRDVQSEGWSWNAETDWPLVPSADGTFLFPADTLKAVFSPTRYPDQEWLRRGLRLYNKKTRTFQHPEVQEVLVETLVHELPWEEVPHVAQQYIVIRAGRIYSNRFLNSDAIAAYATPDEQYARAMLIRGEESEAQSNMLWGNQRGGSHGLGYMPRSGMRHRHTL